MAPTTGYSTPPEPHPSRRRDSTYARVHAGRDVEHIVDAAPRVRFVEEHPLVGRELHTVEAGVPRLESDLTVPAALQLPGAHHVIRALERALVLSKEKDVGAVG